MPSKRIYITLNDSKEKDKIIIKYLSGTYNESSAIKEVLYQAAIHNGTGRVQKGVDSTEKVQKAPKRCNDVEKKTAPQRCNKVQKGANNTEKVQKDDKIKQNELEQLKNFM